MRAANALGTAAGGGVRGFLSRAGLSVAGTLEDLAAVEEEDLDMVLLLVHMLLQILVLVVVQVKDMQMVEMVENPKGLTKVLTQCHKFPQQGDILSSS